MSKTKFKNISEEESPNNYSCDPHIVFYSHDFRFTNTMSAFAVSLGYLMLTVVGYLATNNRYIKPSFFPNKYDLQYDTDSDKNN